MKNIGHMGLKRTFAFLVVFLLGAVAVSSGVMLMADAGSTYNNPPDPPVITGPTSGKIGGGCRDPPWLPGTTLQVSHTWKQSGNYVIKARVMDIYWEWSDWGTLQVTMPKVHSMLTFLEKINEWFASLTGRLFFLP